MLLEKITRSTLYRKNTKHTTNTVQKVITLPHITFSWFTVSLFISSGGIHHFKQKLIYKITIITPVKVP